MNLLFLDFETFWDAKYSLRVMTPPEYILGPRFEVIMCGIGGTGDSPVEVLTEAELRRHLQGLNPDETIIVTHNALFDACILAWRYGFVPYRSLDTLGMARLILGNRFSSLSLGSLAAVLGLPVKGDTVLKMKGLNTEALCAAGMWDEAAAY